MISIIIIFICIFFFLHLSRFTQFSIITVAALLPITLGDIGGIQNFLVIRWLTPVFFLISINDVFSTNITRRTYKLSFRGAEIFVLAVSILLLWAIYSYMRNPVFGRNLTDNGNTEGGISIYYGIAINAMLFISVILFLVGNINKISISKLLDIIIIICIITGILRLITYFWGIETPLLAGAFNYGGEYARYATTAYRIGGLTEVSWVGISALIAKSFITQKLNYVALLIFLFFTFISGGRTISIGISFALMLYTIFFNRYLVKYFLLIAFSTLIVAFFFIPEKYFIGQVDRISSVQGGIKGQDQSRFQVYTISYQNFKNNPVFGKGIAPTTEFIFNSNEKVSYFVRAQLFSGGHGSYISVLSTFGIGGVLYFLIMVFGGIFLSYLEAKKNINNNSELAAIPIFTFVFLIITSIYSISSNNGYSDPTLFFSVGLLSYIRIANNIREFR